MTDAEKLIRDTELFVLDMDGTVYLSNTIIDGALEFVNEARASGKKVLFFTNNTSRNPDEYIKKLTGMGFKVTRSDIVTAGDVTISFLKEIYPDKSIYLVGNPSLIKSFEEAGISLFEAGKPGEDRRPDIVVIGFDTTLTYEKLERACTYIREGSVFLATHPDINCPTFYGFMPDVGAFCAAITLSTGKRPRYLGKPEAETPAMIQLLSGVAREHITFVGDRLYTDVAVGVKNGAHGILVLSGEATMEDVEKSDVKPDAIFASLDAMREYL